MVSGSYQEQRYVFTICDGTGSVSARLWVGENNADMGLVS